jgi:hypothetical protein
MGPTVALDIGEIEEAGDEGGDTFQVIQRQDTLKALRDSETRLTLHGSSGSSRSININEAVSL